MNLVLEALQLDNERKAVSRPEFKRAFTSDAVRRIYEAVSFVWPDGEDLKRLLRQESGGTSGIYVGRYTPDAITRGLTRHSLYSDRILLVDPLMYPARVRDQYNPLLHPEQHRTTTLQWVNLWFSLLPWIDAGIVGFVRAPGDFYPELEVASWEQSKERFNKHPELDALRTSEAQRQVDDDGFLPAQLLALSMPDSQLRRLIREHHDYTDDEVERLISRIHCMREEHPCYLDPEKPTERRGELLQISTGTNYEQAKWIALHSGSYVMTDLLVRWREMEFDRADAGIDPELWSPFAKAFHGLPFSFLDSVPLDAALELRRTGRLETMRNFLRKVWGATAKSKPFDDASIPNLAAELEQRVREAEGEWRKIDKELIGWLRTAGTPLLMGAGPAIAAGYAGWLAAAVTFAGGMSLVHSSMQRRDYRLQYPAGFFLDLKKRQER